MCFLRGPLRQSDHPCVCPQKQIPRHVDGCEGATADATAAGGSELHSVQNVASPHSFQPPRLSASPSTTVRNLRVILDSHLTFEYHNNQITILSIHRSPALQLKH
ncbi:uncharacterized protein V6R79_024921 [Siganus canaliculatus]